MERARWSEVVQICRNSTPTKCILAEFLMKLHFVVNVNSDLTTTRTDEMSHTVGFVEPEIRVSEIISDESGAMSWNYFKNKFNVFFKPNILWKNFDFRTWRERTCSSHSRLESFPFRFRKQLLLFQEVIF